MSDIETPGQPTTIDVEWDGDAYTVEADADRWPFSTMAAYEQGQMLTFLSGVLGPDGLAKFGPRRRTAGEGGELATAIIKAIAEHNGAKSPGE